MIAAYSCLAISLFIMTLAITYRFTGEVHWRAVPFWLRCLGCWGIQDRGLFRFKWGEISIGWGLGIGYSVYHEMAHWFIYPLFFKLFINAPMLITQKAGTEDWHAHYGISVNTDEWSSIHFNWRNKCKIIDMPWAWTHVRHTFLHSNGTVHHHAPDRSYEPPPEETKSIHKYKYILKNGEVQERIATINGEEREWNWKWFTWLGFPKKVIRSINIEFDQEVGERTGSWKGGTIGCGYDWFKGETQAESLKRMERDRVFK